MEESSTFRYTVWQYLFSVVGYLFVLKNIAVDIWTVVSLYQDGDYVYMGLLIFILLSSSVLLQVFSWLWYSDSLDKLETKVENFAERHKLIKAFHVLQLGVYLRYAGVMEVSTMDFLYQKNTFKVSVYLSHDLQMLRLFEVYSDSAPQLILMMSLILQRGELELFSGLKFFSSAASIASTVCMYHRSMRVFLDEHSYTATCLYFLWNLLVIIPRVTALALFSSVYSGYITAHFLSWWMILVFVAWRQKTNFMKGNWEWLYRATVGLIWYFNWFNISKTSKSLKSTVYHIIMGLDTVMLLGFWCWKVIEYRSCWRSLNPYITIPTVLGLYIFGILLKMVYYRWFHPNCDAEKIAELTNLRQNALKNRLQERTEIFYKKNPVKSKNQPVAEALNRGRTMATNFF